MLVFYKTLLARLLAFYDLQNMKIGQREKMSIYGEGSFYKTKTGRWTGVVIRNGKRLTVSSKDRKEALRKFKELQNTPTYNIDGGKLTIQEICDWYTKENQPRMKERKLHGYKSMLAFCKPIMRIKLKDLTRKHLLQLQKTENYLPSTINKHLSSFIHVLKTYSVETDVIIKPSVTDIKNLPCETNRSALDIQDIKKILDHIKNKLETKKIDKKTLFITIAIFTGARKAEILGLCKDSCSLKDKTINIDKQLCHITKSNLEVNNIVKHVRGKYYLTGLKTKSSYRTVLMSDLLHKVLKLYLKNHEGDLIFDGTINGRHPNIWWTSLQKELGICKHDGSFYTVHELRHSTATLMLYLGVSVDVTAKILGHSTVAMTNHYQHLNLEMQREAYGVLNAL